MWTCIRIDTLVTVLCSPYCTYDLLVIIFVLLVLRACDKLPVIIKFACLVHQLLAGQTPMYLACDYWSVDSLIDLFSCKAVSLSNKLTYFLNCQTLATLLFSLHLRGSVSFDVHTAVLMKFLCCRSWANWATCGATCYLLMSRTTWLQTVEPDLQPAVNIGLFTAWRCAQDLSTCKKR